MTSSAMKEREREAFEAFWYSPVEGGQSYEQCYGRSYQLVAQEAFAAALSQSKGEGAGAEQLDFYVVPAGWKLVPIFPTKEMIDAGHMHTMRADEEEPYRARGEAIACWSDMLAAAPSPKSEQGDQQ